MNWVSLTLAAGLPSRCVPCGVSATTVFQLPVGTFAGAGLVAARAAPPPSARAITASFTSICIVVPVVPCRRAEAAGERFEYRPQLRVADVAQAVAELERDRLERWRRGAAGLGHSRRWLNLALPELDLGHRGIAEEAVHAAHDLGDRMLDLRGERGLDHQLEDAVA